MDDYLFKVNWNIYILTDIFILSQSLLVNIVILSHIVPGLNPGYNIISWIEAEIYIIT